jgi:hypothetical protein
MQSEYPGHRRQLWAPGAPQPKDKGRDRREGMAVDLSKVNCPVVPQPGQNTSSHGVPASRAARIVGDHGMSRLRVSWSFQR